jgi:hypothetical protein
MEEVIYEKYVGSSRIPSNVPPGPPGVGIHGLYVMAIFLACRPLATLGWGSVTAMIMMVARIGLCRSPGEAAWPVSLQKRGSKESANISTSTSHLRSPAQTRKKRATWSISDERKGVEWPQKRSPRVFEDETTTHRSKSGILHGIRPGPRCKFMLIQSS